LVQNRSLERSGSELSGDPVNGGALVRDIKSMV